jgi:hypothetical protein
VERLDPTYRRYLEKGLVHEFQLRGCPVRFDMMGKDKRYEGGEGELAPRQSREVQDKHRQQKKGDKAYEKKHPERRAKLVQKKAAHNRKRRR